MPHVIVPSLDLNPSIHHPNRVLATRLTTHQHFANQNPIVPSQHLNPSIPHTNRDPSTPKQAQPYLASQNRAPVVWFWVFGAQARPPYSFFHVIFVNNIYIYVCAPMVYQNGTDSIPWYWYTMVNCGIWLKTVGFTCTHITCTRG